MDTAARLARYFGMSEGFWVNLQTRYDLDRLHADAVRLAALDAIEPLRRPDLDERG